VAKSPASVLRQRQVTLHAGKDGSKYQPVDVIKEVQQRDNGQPVIRCAPAEGLRSRWRISLLFERGRTAFSIHNIFGGEIVGGPVPRKTLRMPRDRFRSTASPGQALAHGSGNNLIRAAAKRNTFHNQEVCEIRGAHE